MNAPARVIVVDDDASIRDAIADCLQLHGYDVRVAGGAAALDVLLQAERPDVIILDWMMPGEDGLSVCRRLQARAIPILMLSAMGSAPDFIFIKYIKLTPHRPNLLLRMSCWHGCVRCCAASTSCVSRWPASCAFLDGGCFLGSAA